MFREVLTRLIYCYTSFPYLKSGLTIPTPVYNSIVQETVALALNDPELVAEIVSSWLKVYLDATVNVSFLYQPVFTNELAVQLKICFYVRSLSIEIFVLEIAE